MNKNVTLITPRFTRSAAFSSCWRLRRCQQFFVASGAILSLLAGCATPPESGATPTMASPAAKPEALRKPSPLDALQKGMTAEQVLALAGKPEEIKPFKSDELHSVQSEVWVYRRVISEETRSVALTTQNVPVTNPLTGQNGTMSEPVMSYETTKVSEITELLMINGRFIEWKRTPKVDRTFH